MNWLFGIAIVILHAFIINSFIHCYIYLSSCLFVILDFFLNCISCTVHLFSFFFLQRRKRKGGRMNCARSSASSSLLIPVSGITGTIRPYHKTRIRNQGTEQQRLSRQADCDAISTQSTVTKKNISDDRTRPNTTVHAGGLGSRKFS